MILIIEESGLLIFTVLQFGGSWLMIESSVCSDISV
jgi:hypothetical protein